MTDLLERTPVQDVLLDERKPEPTVEPPREERGIERPTAKRPVRWIRWMIGALVLIVGATAVTYALRSDGTTEVLDTDGSFQAAETQRMQALAPTGAIDLDGSFQAVENQRLQALAPASDARLGPNQDLAPAWDAGLPTAVAGLDEYVSGLRLIPGRPDGWFVPPEVPAVAVPRVPSNVQ